MLYENLNNFIIHLKTEILLNYSLVHETEHTQVDIWGFHISDDDV